STMDWADWTQGADTPSGRLAGKGFARVARAELRALVRFEDADAARLAPTWNRLPPDAWLRDGGRYRRRRHSCFVHTPATGALEQVAHRAHWQPVDYNALHGGIERMFDPIEASVCQDPAWRRLLAAL